MFEFLKILIRTGNFFILVLNTGAYTKWSLFYASLGYKELEYSLFLYTKGLGFSVTVVGNYKPYFMHHCLRLHVYSIVCQNMTHKK